MKAGITGHQNLGKADTVAWVVENLTNAIVQYEIDYGYTSLALGADQLFAQILAERSIGYTAVLPCREIEKTFQTPAHLENFRRLLRRAAAVETLDFIEPAEIAYFEAGKRVIDLSEIVVAVWNGLPAKGLGGTADAVKYALKQNRHVLHINPVNRQVREI